MKAKVIFKNPITITTVDGKKDCQPGDVIELSQDNLKALVRASVVEEVCEVKEVKQMEPEPTEKAVEPSNQDIEPKFIKEQTEEPVKKTRKKRGTK